MTVRILHAADLHLGRSFPHLGDAGAVRTRDLFETFERICTEALDRTVSALLLAGDLFDTFAPTADVVSQVNGQFERLVRAGVKILVVPGDADSATYERSIWRRAAFAGVHVFLAPHFDLHSFEVGTTILHVHGIAFDGSANAEPLNTLQTDASGVHIALLHGTDDSSPSSSGGLPHFAIDIPRLFAGGVSYAALGHQHNRQLISGPNGAFACYPGSPEGLDAGEGGTRYVALVELGDGSPDVSFLPVNRRHIVDAVLDTTDCRADEVGQQILDLAGDDVLLTAHFTGTPLELLDAHAVTRTLSENFFWLEARDDTTLSASPYLQSVAGENTIQGHFVATLQRRMRGTRDPEERALLERALKLGLRSLHRSSAA